MKVYQVFTIDIWNNIYNLGFFSSLNDPQLINDINNNITNENYHIKPGDLQEYASTFGTVFDTTVYDIAAKHCNIDDEWDDDLQIQIRGFIFDKNELLNEIKEADNERMHNC